MTVTQLRIQYDKISDPTVEYTMRTTVEQTTTQPNALDTCLVVTKGDAGTDEELLRVGDFAEVVTTPLTALPATVNLFYSPSLALIPGGIQNGDTIRISSPFAWQQHFGVPLLFYTTVDDHLFGVNTVSVQTPFPMFGRGLEFVVIRAAAIELPVSGVPPYPVDGVANRDYTAILDTVFAASDHVDSWDDVDVAEGRYAALGNEAQALVDAVKEDSFTGQSDRIYE